MTRWEEIYRGIKPYHFPRIPDFWDKQTRDFVARLRVKRAELIEEQGPLSHAVKRLSGCITAYLDEDRHPSLAPREEVYAAEWKAYKADPSTMTVEQSAGKDAFEALTPAEREEMGRGSYASTRTHVDGRTVDEKGNTVGRWKEPEGSILDKVKAWAQETHHGADHVRRWQEAANGIEPGTFPNAGTMTSTEASEYAIRFMASRWEPAARAIRDREIDFTGGGTVDAELEETLKVINARPDVEVRKYNPETNTLDLLSPAKTSQIAPEHVDRFCEYLERERLVVAKDCGSQHPAIKCKVYEGYIEDVRSGERVHSQIMFNYEQFLGWLRGEYPQRTADETSLWADGKADDHSEAAVKAQLAQQKKLREATPTDNEALAKRTQEILAKAAEDAPTPADIAAAVAAGDWHKVAELAKAQAKAQVPPPGYVWFGWIRQGSVASGQYICIGDGEYEEAILYLASDFGGTEPKPRLYQQNALNGPCRVRHSHDWNDCRREGPFLKTWEEIRAEYGNI